MSIPTISVIMATYNHAPFVAQAIESVLNQVGVDFEFLISDDGSQDETRNVVASISDPRIRFYPNEVNRGACVVTNELIERASGEFIALLNSDDYWSGPDKLACQLQIMRDNPKLGACFGRARFVDRDGKAILKSSIPFGTVFDQDNRSQGAWLRRFFDLGNCICHPTMLIRKSCYEELGMYSNRLRQLPDFDMWIRLVKHYPIHIADRELINFRLLPGENAASQTPVNSIRTMNEHYMIADGYFDDVSREVFLDGFADFVKFRGVLTDVHVDIEKALLYFDDNQWLGRAYKLVGILAVRKLLENPVHRGVMERDYGIGDHWFQQKMGEYDIIRSNIVAEILDKKQGIKSLMLRMFSNFISR